MATVPAKNPAAKKAAAPKAAAPKKEKITAPASTGKKMTVVQIASPIGRRRDQRATLVGLGLNKLHRTRELVDSPSVRGMVEKVKHLVKVVE